jgi:predicted PurR-regulated permease PerM
LVLFLTAYFVVEASSIWAKLLMWLPHEHRAKAASLIRPLGFRMGGYVRGQLLVSVAVAFYLTAGLTLLNVNYALILGVLAGLLNLVPFVGSLIACIFAVVVAANQSIWLAGATLALFACEQWCESNFFVPYLLGRNVELHPLIVLIAILIGATLMGVPGALIAVPLASAAQFLAQEFYLKPLNDGRAEPLSVGGKLITPVDETEMPEKHLARVELPPVIFSASVEGSSDCVEPVAGVVKPVSNLEDMTPVPELTSKEREPNN